jgi:hypothetical protein
MMASGVERHGVDATLVETEQVMQDLGGIVNDSRSRIARGAAVRLAAYAAAAASAGSAGAAVYSQTGLDLQIGYVGGVATNGSVVLTGAGGATVLTLNGIANLTAVGTNFRRWVAISAMGVVFRSIEQTASVGTIVGGLPVAEGANWAMPGRASHQFNGLKDFGTGAQGGVNLSTSAWSDFQQVAGGSVWYMLFRFTHAGEEVYGWLGFTAEVNGVGATSDNYLRITGWGWDDSGIQIAAGFTTAVIPGGGALLALAAGAGGVRLRRRIR